MSKEISAASKHANGFSLLEIILVLVLAGIIAALMVPFLGSALTDSPKPLIRLERDVNLSSNMARIKADRTSSSCAQNINDWDIQEILSENISLRSSLDASSLCDFSDDPAQDNQLDCGVSLADCTSASGDCVFMVSIENTEHPEEYLTYYFPCN